jgi:hypothetical protein
VEASEPGIGGMIASLHRRTMSLYTRTMKRKTNDKDRLKEQSLVRKELLANRKRLRIAREIVHADTPLDQSLVSRVTRVGKKQRDR